MSTCPCIERDINLEKDVVVSLKHRAPGIVNLDCWNGFVCRRLVLCLGRVTRAIHHCWRGVHPRNGSPFVNLILGRAYPGHTVWDLFFVLLILVSDSYFLLPPLQQPDYQLKIVKGVPPPMHPDDIRKPWGMP